MTNKQQTTPLFSHLKAHADKKTIPFHIPSHKCGLGMDPEFQQFIGDKALSIDLIGIEPLDDLHHPQGAILEAQQLAAEAFGAEHSFFSVQGTSGAIFWMIMTVCKPGDKIILPRNAHKSILSAVILADALPIFISPQLDHRLGIMHGITPQDVQAKIDEHPDAKAVLLINPSYYGSTINIKEIVRLSHAQNIPVLVDEAHGALLYFSDSLPDSAMAAGADLAATSVHKLGGSLTQSSILNLQGELVSPKRVKTIISMLTTTSTSYLLLTSLDAARRHLFLNGANEVERTLQLARDTRQKINNIPGLFCHGPEIIDGKAIYGLDETKLLIHLDSLSLSGTQAERWLREHHRIEVELSDLYNLLCFITFGDTTSSVQALITALEDLSRNFYDPKNKARTTHTLPSIPHLATSPRAAFYGNKRSVPLTEAAGFVSGEFVTIYPPGIPVLIPGEVITEENIKYIQEHIKEGLIIHGTEDPTTSTIQVLI